MEDSSLGSDAPRSSSLFDADKHSDLLGSGWGTEGLPGQTCLVDKTLSRLDRKKFYRGGAPM
jgi:hypothetical protein